MFETILSTIPMLMPVMLNVHHKNSTLFRTRRFKHCFLKCLCVCWYLHFASWTKRVNKCIQSFCWTEHFNNHLVKKTMGQKWRYGWTIKMVFWTCWSKFVKKKNEPVWNKIIDNRANQSNKKSNGNMLIDTGVFIHYSPTCENCRLIASTVWIGPKVLNVSLRIMDHFFQNLKF